MMEEEVDEAGELTGDMTFTEGDESDEGEDDRPSLEDLLW